MVMRTLAQDFLLYLEAELGYSTQTTTSYCYDLPHFFDFLDRHDVAPSADAVTTAVVREWIVEMHRRGLSSATIARHLYALRSFWKYLVELGHASPNPVAKVLGPEDLRRLLEASQHSHSTFSAFRNHAMMAMLIFTGMRRGELINLRRGDVSLTERAVTVRGKGNKMRVVPLVDQAVDAVRDWLEFRPADCKHDYLFATAHGNRIHPSRMQRIWKGILGRSGVEQDGVTLHTLRHSMATLLLQSGECSLVEIQRILGHSRLDTTAIYLHVNDAELRSAVGSHPLVVASDHWD